MVIRNPGFAVLASLTALLTVTALALGIQNPVIRQWDESRLTVNAMEMSRGGNWLVPTFDGSPDLWNTKPPLMIWLQALSIKIWGLSEWAIRFPSLLLAVWICVLTYHIVKTLSQNPRQALWAPLALTACFGFNREHVAWTGDYDVLLVAMMLNQLWTFFQGCEEGWQKNARIHYFFLWLALAVLAKGVAGLLLLPAFGIYLLYRRQLLVFLARPFAYVGLLAFLLIGPGYYLLREAMNPGYLDAVYHNELGGRFLEVNEGHNFPWHFYLGQIFGKFGSYWAYLALVAPVIAWHYLNEATRRWLIFSALGLVQFVMVISSSRTKLTWYDAPVYPLLACGFALGFPDMLRRWHFLRIHVLAGILLVAIGYSFVVGKRLNQPTEDRKFHFFELSYHLRDAYRQGMHLKEQFLVSGEYSAQFHMYRDYHDIPLKRFEEVKPGDMVYVADPVAIDCFKTGWEYATIESQKTFQLIKLIRKNAPVSH